jgi:hypothetical protein
MLLLLFENTDEKEVQMANSTIAGASKIVIAYEMMLGFEIRDPSLLW